MHHELKFLFTGTPGVGKSTAIRVVSDSEPVSTDVLASDEVAVLKECTTAAMDFGEITLDDGEILRLYGTPGQERFRFMWDILADGALGLIILVDHSRPDPLADLTFYAESFLTLIERAGAVVGITRFTSGNGLPTLAAYQDALSRHGLCLPVMAVDIRQPEDVRLLLDVLMTTAEF